MNPIVADLTQSATVPPTLTHIDNARATRFRFSRSQGLVLPYACFLVPSSVDFCPIQVEVFSFHSHGGFSLIVPHPQFLRLYLAKPTRGFINKTEFTLVRLLARFSSLIYNRGLLLLSKFACCYYFPSSQPLIYNIIISYFIYFVKCFLKVFL